MTRPRVLVARLDSVGDVLLAGPAVRAVRASGAEATLLCSGRGLPAARLLPDVDRIQQLDAAWILADAPPIRLPAVLRTVAELRLGRYDEALILTSFHQSSLPLALLLRMAGIPRIAAVSEDYPGSLLDVRIAEPPPMHEAQRAAAIAEAAGYPAVGDRLAIRADLPDLPQALAGAAQGVERLAVVHPGSDAPARGLPVGLARAVVEELSDAGWTVAVTGGPQERALTASVAGRSGVDLGGRTSLPELAAVLRAAEVLVAGNTGAGHLAAAVGTPVVALWAPTVPAARWRPWGVPSVVLGDPGAPCADTRVRVCPHCADSCLSALDPREVLRAVDSLMGART